MASIRLLVMFVACLLVACAPSPAAIASASPTVASSLSTPVPSASASASVSASPAASPTATARPDCATATLTRMTTDQRIGQLFLLGLANDQLGPVETNAIRTEHFGSVWLTEQTTAGATAIRALASSAQALATSETTAGVRFFVAANQEGGIIQSLSGAGFSTIPSALAQSAVDPALLRAQAAQWGRELGSAGINLNFAPVLDVVPPGTDAQNEPIGVLKRGYGHDPATVSAHGLAFLGGMEDSGVVTTAKHFPGLGRVRGNTDFSAQVVDTQTTLTDPSLAPFRNAIAAGVPMVMIALATYQQIDPNALAVFSPIVMRQLLRGSLGFDGVIVSDDLGATAAVASIAPADRAIDFLAAGGDLIVSKTVAPALEMAAALRARAASDSGFRARIDDAALRVLRVKVARSLVSCTR